MNRVPGLFVLGFPQAVEERRSFGKLSSRFFHSKNQHNMYRTAQSFWSGSTFSTTDKGETRWLSVFFLSIIGGSSATPEPHTPKNSTVWGVTGSHGERFRIRCFPSHSRADVGTTNSNGQNPTVPHWRHHETAHSLHKWKVVGSNLGTHQNGESKKIAGNL